MMIPLVSLWEFVIFSTFVDFPHVSCSYVLPLKELLISLVWQFLQRQLHIFLFFPTSWLAKVTPRRSSRPVYKLISQLITVWVSQRNWFKQALNNNLRTKFPSQSFCVDVSRIQVLSQCLLSKSKSFWVEIIY